MVDRLTGPSSPDRKTLPSLTRGEGGQDGSTTIFLCNRSLPGYVQIVLRCCLVRKQKMLDNVGLINETHRAFFSKSDGVRMDSWSLDISGNGTPAILARYLGAALWRGE